MFQTEPITDETVASCIQQGKRIIGYRHKSVFFWEHIVFHKLGTIVVQSPDRHFSVKDFTLCHAISTRKPVFKSCAKPLVLFTLHGNSPYVPENVGVYFRKNRHRIEFGYMDKKESFPEYNDLKIFRKLPPYWIDWGLLFITLKMGENS